MAAEAGASRYEIVRQKKHIIVDFHFADIAPVRVTVSSSNSDHRGYKNTLACLKRAAKQKRELH
jgi:hypothetical protein